MSQYAVLCHAFNVGTCVTHASQGQPQTFQNNCGHCTNR